MSPGNLPSRGKAGEEVNRSDPLSLKSAVQLRHEIRAEVLKECEAWLRKHYLPKGIQGLGLIASDEFWRDYYIDLLRTMGKDT
jgi:hypothetical protein